LHDLNGFIMVSYGDVQILLDKIYTHDSQYIDKWMPCKYILTYGELETFEILSYFNTVTNNDAYLISAFKDFQSI